MSEGKVLQFDEIPRVDRGGGIYSSPLNVEATGAKVFSSGITTFPEGASVALHTHNANEQVVFLEGEGTMEIEGKQLQVKPYDTALIPAGVRHRVLNSGDGQLRILWVYDSVRVTRTYVETGEETGQFGKLSTD